MNSTISLLSVQKFLKNRYTIKKNALNVNMDYLCLCYTLLVTINKFIQIAKNKYITKTNKQINILNELFEYIKKNNGEEMYKFFKSELIILYKIKNIN